MLCTRGHHRGPSQSDMGSSQSQSRRSWGQRPGHGTLSYAVQELVAFGVLAQRLFKGYRQIPLPPDWSSPAKWYGLKNTCLSVVQKSMYSHTSPWSTLLRNGPCMVVHAETPCTPQPWTKHQESRLFPHYSASTARAKHQKGLQWPSARTTAMQTASRRTTSILNGASEVTHGAICTPEATIPRMAGF